jgi:ribonucleoside-diphosphate reductase alpha chain
MCVPNSPQWFNTGLHESYGIKENHRGIIMLTRLMVKLKKSTSAYERPQPHACFILSVDDDLVNEGGIMDLWVREARIFKYGSGVGTNYSNIRGEGEKLSGGGTSSGLMSFLKIGDRAAGAIKSGGTTRRAAKMVCLDLDHPEVVDFINWKVEEEKKVSALISAGYASDYEGEAYKTVSGQNSNNSVRIPNEFFEKLEKGEDWELTARSDGRVMKKVPSQELWNQISYAAWRCADPGTQYNTTINEWHTCPEGGEIRASNPCSEYMFLDNTACNLASANLMKFFDLEKNHFDVEGFEYVCRLWTTVLEISVLMAQFPSKEVAQFSYEYRTLGLGYANLGTMLMVSGIPYDSEQARAIAGAITAIMTGTSLQNICRISQNTWCFPTL